MKNHLSNKLLAVLTLALSVPVMAQVAGSTTTTDVGIAESTQTKATGSTTTVGLSVAESTQNAMGWSAKKSLMGKTLYNDADQKVGKVDDLIISPDNNVTYVIVGAGGFIGIGRHDVAIPVKQVQEAAGRLVMAGATKESVKAMPTFKYATDTTQQSTMGWSAKKSLMGKTLYNDAGQKVGEVVDMIISPDNNVSYVIVGAGGFIGIGQHDVAIPVIQIKEEVGKLVMAGATKESVKAMPAFKYATDATRRDSFVAGTEQDIAHGKAVVADLKKKADIATADAKGRINAQIIALQADLTAVDAKLAEMKQATDARWGEFQAGVSAATARLRQSISAAES